MPRLEQVTRTTVSVGALSPVVMVEMLPMRRRIRSATAIVVNF
jgi:hypothetical protein